MADNQVNFDKLFDGLDEEQVEGVVAFVATKNEVKVRVMGKTQRVHLMGSSITMLAALLSEVTGRSSVEESKWLQKQIYKRAKKRWWQR